MSEAPAGSVPWGAERPLDVMASKLIRPRVPASFVSRPRLDELLSTGSTRTLTVVSAGAGWGKTLAVAHWADSISTTPVGWLSLDPGDNEVGRFWSCFLAALHEAGAMTADGPLVGLLPGMGSAADTFHRLSAGLAALPRTVVVVLDDFHLITDPTILEHLATLLHHRHPRLRLCLLTRTDPALPLHRLRLNDEVVEVRSRDLAFGVGDASELLAAHHVPVDHDDAVALVDRTEGWPAGLRLAALFLAREDTERSVDDFAGDDRAVSTYLAEEVLASLPPEVQTFLLRTSVVERLSSSLAEVLTGQTQSQRHLETLEASNTFVVGIGPGRQWFRYHALMREMLQHRLRVDEPDQLPILHRQAAAWYGEHGHPVDALRHAAEAADWDLVGELFVTQAAPLIVTVERSAIRAQLARIPPARMGESAALALCGAALMFLDGRFLDVQAHLDIAITLMERHPGPTDVAVHVALLALTSPATRARGDMHGLIRAARRSLVELAGPAAMIPAGPAYRAVALGNLGTGLLWAGQLAEAEHRLREALTAADEAGVEATKINVLAHLALVSTIGGVIDEAGEHGNRAAELVAARGWAPLPQVATAYLSLALLQFERNDLDGAQLLLEQGRTAGNHEATARWALAIVQSQMFSARGDVASARAELSRVPSEVADRDDLTLLGHWRALAQAQADLAEGDAASAARLAPQRDGPFVTQELICLARAALHQDEPRRADELLHSAREQSPTGGHSTVEVWLLTAVAADRLREDGRALDALRRALDASQATSVRRPFAAVDPLPLLRLLDRLSVVSPERTEVIEDIRTIVLPTSSPRVGPGLTEPLTDRELSVLQFLPAMMTNDEIAAQLHVSVNTVKAHLKGLFRKLGVSSRRQAVVRGRELGLLAGLALAEER